MSESFNPENPEIPNQIDQVLLAFYLELAKRNLKVKKFDENSFDKNIKETIIYTINGENPQTQFFVPNIKRDYQKLKSQKFGHYQKAAKTQIEQQTKLANYQKTNKIKELEKVDELAKKWMLYSVLGELFEREFNGAIDILLLDNLCNLINIGNNLFSLETKPTFDKLLEILESEEKSNQFWVIIVKPKELGKEDLVSFEFKDAN